MLLIFQYSGQGEMKDFISKTLKKYLHKNITLWVFFCLCFPSCCPRSCILALPVILCSKAVFWAVKALVTLLRVWPGFRAEWAFLWSLRQKLMGHCCCFTGFQGQSTFPIRLFWKIFPVVMYGYESWTIKKAEHQRIDALGLWCWRRLLRVPWTARRSNQSILKEISPEYSLEQDWCWSWNSNTLATWCEELTHWKSPWCWERLKAGGERDEIGWDGWVASLAWWTWAEEPGSPWHYIVL